MTREKKEAINDPRRARFPASTQKIPQLFCLQPHQSSSHPAYSTSDYQQSNYPSGTAGPSPGFQLNLLDALSTISSHDDYKCVPRILCEMASGKLPGRSLGKQGSGFFEFLGRNIFTEYVAAESSPHKDTVFSNGNIERESHDGFFSLPFQLADENRRRRNVSAAELRQSDDPRLWQPWKFRGVLPGVPKVSEGHERLGLLSE